jgi:hypothetical protein
MTSSFGIEAGDYLKSINENLTAKDSPILQELGIHY